MSAMQQPKLTRDLLEHRQALLGFILALTRDFNSAEEIFQETALAILDEAAAGRQAEPFLPWAREVARRRVAEHHRVAAQNRRAIVMPADLLDGIALAFDENEESREEARSRQKHLPACVAALTERVQRMIDLRYHQRLAVAAIAQDVGWTVDAVHVALSRARKTLAECIERRLHTPGEAR